MIKNKLLMKKVALFYQFSNLFNLPGLHKATLRLIERCFTIVCDTDNFKHLDYTSVSKILASSSLFLTSEIEVYKVAERWLNYNIEERSKYIKDLLLKARINLLSKDTLRKLSNDSTFLKNDDRCVKILNEPLDCRESNLNKSTSHYQKSRYCTHKSFNLLVCGGFDSLVKTRRSRNVSCVDVNSTGGFKAYPPMITGRVSLNVVYVKGDFYVFGGFSIHRKFVMSVDKYSLTSNTWSQVAEMYDDRKGFCTCAFMDKILVFGGVNDETETNSCLQFDTSDYSWKEVSEMNNARSCTACVVYEERIVVSGGLYNLIKLTNVESYDVLPDKWSPMPNMNSGKCNHSLVVVKNKLFALFEKNCEVFDNIGKNFITIKPLIPEMRGLSRAFSIENKIFVISDLTSKMICYDTNKNELSEELCRVTRYLYGFSCVKVPCLHEKTEKLNLSLVCN